MDLRRMVLADAACTHTQELRMHSTCKVLLNRYDSQSQTQSGLQVTTSYPVLHMSVGSCVLRLLGHARSPCMQPSFVSGQLHTIIQAY